MINFGIPIDESVSLMVKRIINDHQDIFEELLNSTQSKIIADAFESTLYMDEELEYLDAYRDTDNSDYIDELINSDENQILFESSYYTDNPDLLVIGISSVKYNKLLFVGITYKSDGKVIALNPER
jgi:hypothetical protein